MILPTKYTPISDSLLGQAAAILESHAGGDSTVNEHWVAFSAQFPDAPFDRFLEALTLLYLLGAVDHRSGLLHWSN